MFAINFQDGSAQGPAFYLNILSRLTYFYARMEKIQFEQARTLCSDPNSGFTLISGEQHISLPPKFLGHIGHGVREQLDSKIGFFSEK